MIVRHLAPLSLLAAVACASSGTVPPGDTGVPNAAANVAGPAGASQSFAVVNQAQGEVRTIDVPIEKAWAALPAVYESLKIPVTMRSAQARTLGNDKWQTRRQVGGTPMEQIVDCGGSPGERNTDSYMIVFSLATELRAAGPSQTQVITTVQATGKSVFVNQSTGCTSVGGLEAMIVDALKREAAK